MNNNDRIAVAQRWADAMTMTSARTLKSLAEVLDDDVRTENLTGKDAVLEWFKAWKGAPMFRTGKWLKPTVTGDVVTFTSVFDPKAAYHSATVSMTVGPDGLIKGGSSLLRIAPDPLGTVVHRVWGSRRGKDRLPDHLASTYGVNVKKITQLDHGVFRADLTGQDPWIVRLFPSDRPLADVKADAAVLRFLESKDFPAERCVADVSEHEGQGVLVTGSVRGPKPKPTEASQRELGDLVGRLHATKGGPKAVRRPAGALHLYTVDCTVASEIEIARASLQAAAFRGKTDARWEAMMAALAKADDFSSLPTALMHPDPGCVNAISSGGRIVMIDWAGAGHGPRILGLGLLLHGSAQAKDFNRGWVDAIMGAYTQHVKLTAAELERLEEAVAHRGLIHEAYAWGVGMATQRKPGGYKAWPHNAVGIKKMADHIRER